MSANEYVYAKQVPPEFQGYDLDCLEEGGIYSDVIVTGNDRMNSHNDDLLKKVIECAEDIIADFDDEANVAEWVKSEFTRKDVTYSNSYSMEEFLNNNYATEKHPVWTADDAAKVAAAYLKALDGMYNGYRATDKSPDDCRAEMLSIFTGEEYETATINGYCQGDWQTVYYPKEQHNKDAIEELEILYFNKGTEWIVHDGIEPPENPDDIDGYAVYCLHNPREEIAIAEGVSPDKIFLYTSERTMQTVYHESSENPQIKDKEKATVERD